MGTGGSCFRAMRPDATLRSRCVVAAWLLAVPTLAGCGGSHARQAFGSTAGARDPSRVRVDLGQARDCLERHGWPVEHIARNELDVQRGGTVWDMEFRHSGLVNVGWTGDASGGMPQVLARCLRERNG